MAVWRIFSAQPLSILKGKKVAPFTKLIVTPASRKIYEQALADGTLAYTGRSRCHDHSPKLRSVLRPYWRYSDRW